MLTPQNPTGTIMINTRPMVIKPTISEGAVSVTITIPGPGLAFYVPWPASSWLLNGWWVVSQSVKTCVLGFATPAPSGAEMLVLIFH